MTKVIVTAQSVPCVPPDCGLLNGKVATALGRGIKDACIAVTANPDNIRPCDINPQDCDYILNGTGVSGSFDACLCAGRPYYVRPYLNLDPLNGVNTWDLILISRHILNLEPLNTPYKLISADANKSGTVTTFDIVELRKLILGSYAALPNNTSWRFIDAKHIFTQPSNPFEDNIDSLETIIIPKAPYSGTADFIGCKIGDIDLTATPNGRPALGLPLGVSMGLPAPKKGAAGRISVPVTYQGATELEGYQFALRFDAERLELESVSQGDLGSFNLHNFGLDSVAEGIVKTVWFPSNPMLEERGARQGDVLFYLNLRDKQPEAEQQPADPFLATGGFLHMGWETTGIPHPLVDGTAAERSERPTPAKDPLAAYCAPNPTDGAVTLHIGPTLQKEGVLVLYGPTGRQMAAQRIALSATGTAYAVESLHASPAGLYLWKLVAGDETTCGTVVKK